MQNSTAFHSEPLDDPKLPGLRQATDSAEMRRRLAAILEPDLREKGLALADVRHRVLKHVFGKRCVIEYRLDLAGDSPAASPLIGKVYRLNRGQRIYGFMADLAQQFQNGRPDSCRLAMPVPVAYCRDLDMVLQSLVPGRQLSTYSEDDDLLQPVKKVARNLALLHSAAPNGEPPQTFADHMLKLCRPGPEALLEEQPGLARLVEPILQTLENDPVLQQAPLVMAHGDLGLSQIFITEDRAYFIDFDGFGVTHAALDLANFMIAIEVHHKRRSRELGKVFLETYLETQSPDKLTGLKTYRAFIYFRRAMICFKKKEEADWRQRIQKLLEKSTAVLSV